MKQVAMLVILVPAVISTAAAQDDTAADRTAAKEEMNVTEAAATGRVARPPSLDELEWMVGQWIDRGKESTVTTDCAWTKNRKFLTRSFRITMNGQVSLEGTQVIGWDPIARRIRSWTFDSEGGFGEGYWTRDGSRWLVKTSFVLAGGERASAVNVITYVDRDTLRWQSVDREIGGQLLPNIPEITIVRQKAGEAESEEGENEVSQ